MVAATMSSSDQPLGEMNTTPLIDVLLVLLVMLILTVPVATHTLEVALPQAGKPPTGIVDPIRNRLVVTQHGAIEWNGDAVSRGELTGLLAEVRATTPEPEVQFEPEALASYELSAQVLNQVKQARLSRFGLSGTERYRQFDRRD